MYSSKWFAMEDSRYRSITLALVVMARKSFIIKNLLVRSTMWIVAKMLYNNVLNLSRDDARLPHGALFMQTHSATHTINPHDGEFIAFTAFYWTSIPHLRTRGNQLEHA